jgi:hypothetical protein
MMSEKSKCPKCTGEMIQGFVPDYTQGAALVLAWHQDQPKRSFWRSTKAPFLDGIPIGSFRCQKCGFLEFYANAEFAAQ